MRLTVAADCLLEEIPLSLERALKEALTIPNPKYVAARRYGRWIGKSLKPTLKYYQPQPTGLRFPRGFANQAIRLCRELEGADPELIDQRLRLPEVNLSCRAELRPYQEEAVARVCARSFGVLEAGTGSGKTVMALAVIAARRQPTLVLVHTKELLYQWQERIDQFLGLEAGLVGDGRFELADVTVAIVNTARKRVAELAPRFGHLVVDECHRVPAALFTDVVSRCSGWYLLGLSATAFRSDEGMTRIIYWYMGERVHRVEQDELAATGAVVKPELIQRQTSFDYRYRGEYQALIKALVGHEGRNRQIVDDVIEQAGREDSGILLVVSDRVEHCRVFLQGLERAGVSAALLTGRTPPEERGEVVRLVQEGGLKVLVATLQLIGEGFDCPGLATLFLTTPITFEGRLLQVLGRIMRPAEGKRAQVFDYVDHRVPVLARSAARRQRILAGLA